MSRSRNQTFQCVKGCFINTRLLTVTNLHSTFTEVVCLGGDFKATVDKSFFIKPSCKGFYSKPISRADQMELYLLHRTSALQNPDHKIIKFSKSSMFGLWTHFSPQFRKSTFSLVSKFRWLLLLPVRHLYGAGWIALPALDICIMFVIRDNKH